MPATPALQALRRLLRRPAAGTAAAPEAPVRQRLLFVCLGNLCRSPTAEAVMRARLARAGLAGSVAVDSAGTSGANAGEAPDARAQRHAAARGYVLAPLRARRVTPDDFERFDRILAMDDDNLAWLRARAPAGCRARVEPLLLHAQRTAGPTAVPDPYYGPAAGFEQALDLIEEACDGLLQAVRAELAQAPSRQS